MSLAIPHTLPDLPEGWTILEKRFDGAALRRRDGLAVIISASVEADGHPWLHVSLSRKKQLPSWSDIRLVKNLFIGGDRYAYQILPPQDRYVNINPFVLHLWSPLDHQPIPEFSGFINGVRSI